jgi:hypothetical protein
MEKEGVNLTEPHRKFNAINFALVQHNAAYTLSTVNLKEVNITAVDWGIRI